MKSLVVLSGAGISAESGIKTFRDSDGLWEGHDVQEVASPEGWERNPKLVLDFYNKRRAQLKEVEPNLAHILIKDLEEKFIVNVVTQNVDNLHERAKSKNVFHLHGMLTQIKSTQDENYIQDWEGDLNIGDTCPSGYQLRPNIVWFGEEVPMLNKAAELVYDADIVIIIGTSLQVYPAAGLIRYAQNAKVFYIDPNPKTNFELNQKDYTLIKEPATKGMKTLFDILMQEN